MQIVIKMSKKDYELYKADDWNIPKCLRDVLANGAPLPEGHGRLIDADWVKNTLDIYALNEYNGQFIRRNDIDSIPTIIEADKEESEEEPYKEVEE